jgi:hypothetical protein
MYTKLLFKSEKKYEQRTNRKIPAVTIVAACIRDDTGVGPSIASGNQICNPACADLPTAANTMKKQSNVTSYCRRISTSSNIRELLVINGVKYLYS